MQGSARQRKAAQRNTGSFAKRRILILGFEISADDEAATVSLPRDTETSPGVVGHATWFATPCLFARLNKVKGIIVGFLLVSQR